MKTNGKIKIRQLKPAQQLQLRTIQSRMFKHLAEAAELTKAGQAANQEFTLVVQNFAKQMGINPDLIGFDTDKLEFVPKGQVMQMPAPAPAPVPQQTKQQVKKDSA